MLEFPEILAEAGNGRRRVDDILGAVQRERPPAFREVPVVANVDAELDEGRIEYRVARVARLEEELLVESRIDLRICVFRYLPRNVPSASMTAAVL